MLMYIHLHSHVVQNPTHPQCTSKCPHDFRMVVIVEPPEITFTVDDAHCDHIGAKFGFFIGTTLEKSRLSFTMRMNIKLTVE